MRKHFKRLLSLLLTFVMILGLSGITANAAGNKADARIDGAHVYTEAENALLENDVFASISSLRSDAAQAAGGLSRLAEADYIRMVPDVISAIKSSATYVEGSLQQNGNFLVWQTTTGIPCCYDPRMEAKLHGASAPISDEELMAIDRETKELEARLGSLTADLNGGAPSSVEIGLIQPYWESNSSYADSSFRSYSPYYKSMWQSLYQATGGSSSYRYSMTNATVDNVAKAIANCAIVIMDSHGTTDYSGSNGDYTSRANSSYLCLTTNSGVTSTDTAAKSGTYGTYYDALKGSGYAYVNGNCIANHMTKNAPHSLVYMGICLGMATNKMFTGLRNKGVEVVYGYSQSVSFVGERQYMESILGYVKNGDTFASALSKTKSSLGSWDPAYSSYSLSQAKSNKVAFPIAVSSEDSYPGQGNVDAVQTVYSTWLRRFHHFLHRDRHLQQHFLGNRLRERQHDHRLPEDRLSGLGLSGDERQRDRHAERQHIYRQSDFELQRPDQLHREDQLHRDLQGKWIDLRHGVCLCGRFRHTALHGDRSERMELPWLGRIPDRPDHFEAVLLRTGRKLHADRQHHALRALHEE